ncbi:MAG: hypothetical protein ABH914_04265 [Candidatus Omnitrophota bacterium]
MTGNRVFQVALLVSLTVHGVLLMQHYGFDTSLKNKEKKIEISYLKKPPEYKPEPKKETLKKLKKEPFLELKDKAIIEKRVPPPYIEKNNLPANPRPQLALKTQANRPSIINVQVVSVKKRVSLPAVMEADKIKNPSYISYYQIVREKIRRAAFRSYNGRELGEVTLSFIISNDGSPQKIFLMEEYSSESAYLREIAVDSVKSASPFPRFPKELDYSRLLFRLLIKFKVE